MAKNKKVAKRAKRKATRRPASKDVAQTALDMVERAIGEKLSPKRSR